MCPLQHRGVDLLQLNSRIHLFETRGWQFSLSRPHIQPPHHDPWGIPDPISKWGLGWYLLPRNVSTRPDSYYSSWYYVCIYPYRFHLFWYNKSKILNNKSPFNVFVSIFQLLSLIKILFSLPKHSEENKVSENYNGEQDPIIPDPGAPPRFFPGPTPHP